MASNNKISITLNADDRATPAIAAMAEKIKAIQKDLAASVASSSAEQEASYTSVSKTFEASQDQILVAARASAGEQSVISKDIAASNATIAASSEEAATASVASSEKSAAASKAQGEVVSKSVGMVAAGTAAVVAVAAGVMAKHAADFQTSTTRLVTSAGELQTNLAADQQGILQVARDTGASSQELAGALYVINSGGQHGAAGLTVLKAAAQGAAAENSDLKTTADAVTSALTDYHLKASDSAQVTTKLVAATSAGKTSFEELAGAMPAILPVASAAHVSLNDILGDLAAMTIHGMSAQQSAQNLADVIRHMQNPTAMQAKELALLNLTTTQLADDMKNKGLSGTLQEISDKIAGLMPPGSDKVILNLKTALNDLSPAVKELGQKLFDGSMSAGEYSKAAQKLDPISAKQATSFGTLAGSMHRIGDQQMTGAQVMQNYGQALAKATGDSTGLNVALMLSGENAGVANQAIKTVSSATTEAGGNVKGWADIQATFNQRWKEFQQGIATSAITIGMALLPPLTSLMTTFTQIIDPITHFIAHHQELTADLLIGVGVLSAFVAIMWAAEKATTGLGNSFDFATGLAKKFATATGLVNTIEETQGIGAAASEAGILSKGTTVVGTAARTGGSLVAGEAVAAGTADAGASIAAGAGAALTGPVGLAIGAAIAGAFAAKVIASKVTGNDQQKNVDQGLDKNSTVATDAKTNSKAAKTYVKASKDAKKDNKSDYLAQTKAAELLDSQAATATGKHSAAVAKMNDDLKKHGPLSSQYQADIKAVNAAYSQQTSATSKAHDADLALDKSKLKLGISTKGYNDALKDQAATSPTVANLNKQLTIASENERVAKEKVTTAQNNYNVAVQLFGAGSGPAQDALKNLDKAEGDYNTTKSTATTLQTDINNLEKDAHDKRKNLTDKTKDLKKAQDDLNTALGNEPKGGLMSQFISRAGSDLKNWGKDIASFFAVGTDYAPGGMAVVGEHGPELVNLPRGSQVTPAQKTARMMNSGSRGGVTIQSMNVYNNVDAQSVVNQIGYRLAMGR